MPEPDSTPNFPERLSRSEAYRLRRGTWPLRAVVSRRIALPGTFSAPGEARRAVDPHVGERLDSEHAGRLRLLVSELVTNAVLHGAKDHGVEMYLAIAARCIRVEVCDGGSGFDLDHAPRPVDAIGGCGLRLLDSLASRWGVAGDDGTCVWFELDL